MPEYDRDETNSVEQWIDTYIKYARNASRPCFDLLHETYGVWTLLVTAANRASLIFEGREYYPTTSMLIVDTAEIKYDPAVSVSTTLLKKSGINWSSFGQSPFMLDEGEPSNFVDIGTGTYYWVERTAFQRSCKIKGEEVPYLAVVSHITPRNMAEYTSPSRLLWADKFISRSLMIAPTDEDIAFRKEAPFPIPLVPYDGFDQNVHPFPSMLIESLQRMDEQLEKGKPVMVCSYPAWYHFHRYEYYLNKCKPTPDLDNIYSNLGELHMIVSMLFALIGGEQKIQIWHVNRAQKFCELVRLSVDSLYRRVISMQDKLPAEGGDNESKIDNRMD